MMIILTGTPGCGKTTVSNKLESRLDAYLISINGLIEEYDLLLGIDQERGYKIVDTEAMIPIVDTIKEEHGDELIIFEGHLAHDYPNADKVVVLRCNPDVLQERLSQRNWKDKKVKENVSAEILGVCTTESYETYQQRVQEIDTSDLSVDEVVDTIIDIINDKESYPLGEIDYLSEYFTYLE